MRSDALLGVQRLAQVVAGQKLLEDPLLRDQAEYGGERHRSDHPAVAQCRGIRLLVVRAVVIMHRAGDSRIFSRPTSS